MARRPGVQRDWDNAHLTDAAIDVHHDDPGVRLPVHHRRGVPGAEGLAEPGAPAVHAAAAGLGALPRARHRPQARTARPRRPRAPGVHRPPTDQLWLTDITEHPTGEGSLYLCAVNDACSNRIVGYSIAARMTADLAVNALHNALALRGGVGTIVHSDRGSQLRSHAYVRALRDAKAHGSMGRVGTCADNAAMESFFSLLQKNVLNRQRWQTRHDLRLAIVV